MAKRPTPNEIKWQRSFQQKVNWVTVTNTKANVKVIVAGAYSIVKFYGRSVLLPGSVASSSVSRPGRMGPDTEVAEDKVMPGSQLALDDYREPRGLKPRTAPQNRYRHVKRNLGQMMLLINHNFDPHTARFVTLTFRQKATTYVFVKQECQKFFKRLRKNVPGIQYLAMPDRHEDGSWHVHLIIDRELPMTKELAAPFINAGVIRGKKGSWEGLWTLGQTNQQDLDKGGNLGNAVSRYMMKNAGDKELAGSHTFWRSDNLKQPVKLEGQEAARFVRELADANELPVYSYACENVNEYVGSMNVFEFCHDRKATLHDKAWWWIRQTAA